MELNQRFSMERGQLIDQPKPTYKAPKIIGECMICHEDIYEDEQIQESESSKLAHYTCYAANGADCEYLFDKSINLSVKDLFGKQDEFIKAYCELRDTTPARFFLEGLANGIINIGDIDIQSVAASILNLCYHFKI